MAIVVIRCFKDAILDDYKNVDYVWRICLGLGCVPAVLGAYFRTKIPETPRFTAYVKGDVKQAKADMAKVMKTEGEQAHVAQDEYPSFYRK